MRVPKELPPHAADYWRRNAPLCEKQGTLTEYDRDTFSLLCYTWERIQQAIEGNRGNIEFVCLSKQFQNLSKCFGLDPVSRKKLGITHEDTLEEILDF